MGAYRQVGGMAIRVHHGGSVRAVGLLWSLLFYVLRQGFPGGVSCTDNRRASSLLRLSRLVRWFDTRPCPAGRRGKNATRWWLQFKGRPLSLILCWNIFSIGS